MVEIFLQELLAPEVVCMMLPLPEPLGCQDVTSPCVCYMTGAKRPVTDTGIHGQVLYQWPAAASRP